MISSDTEQTSSWPPPRPETIILLGNRLSLDFANTLVWRLRERPIELFESYEALIAWHRHAGAVDDGLADCLLQAAREQEAEAEATVRQAIGLREAVYRIFLATIESRQPASADLAAFNAVLDDGMSRAKVAPGESGFVWGWGEEAELARPLWEVARSAAEVLTLDDLSRVRQCPGEGCGWLFLDTTRNGNRRWCLTAGCGNRARVRAHYQRRVAGRSA